MVNRDVNKGIATHLYPFLKENGYKKSTTGFIKSEGDMAHCIKYASLKGDKCRPTSFKFWIMSRAVYVILKLSLNQEIQPNTFATLIALSQARVFGLKPKEFQVDNIEDIRKMCDQVIEYLKNEGFMFYEKNKDLQNILNQAKQLSPPEKFFSTSFGQWGINNLILCRLLDDSDFEGLSNSYLNYIYSTQGEGIFHKRVEQVVQYLNKHSSEELKSIVNYHS